MNGISLPVIHPAFERLKNSGRLLHLIAAVILIGHALSHQGESYNPVYFWCQIIFAIDILLLVFMGRNLAVNMPGINAFFRLVEFLFFIGISILLLLEAKWFQGSFHAFLGGIYLYLFYCERRLLQTESISIFHTGISIPGLPGNKFLLWTQVNDLKVSYDSIHIHTTAEHWMNFNFRSNLSFDELDQIHDFCRHYLGK